MLPVQILHYPVSSWHSYIDNLSELLAGDDVQELLDVIDDVIVNNILGNHNEPDKEGILLQRIYDQIFNQN